MRMDGQDWVEFVRFALRPSVIRHMLARPRFRLALRAGWHMALFVLAVCFALPGVWLRSLAALAGRGLTGRVHWPRPLAALTGRRLDWPRSLAAGSTGRVHWQQAPLKYGAHC